MKRKIIYNIFLKSGLKIQEDIIITLNEKTINELKERKEFLKKNMVEQNSQELFIIGTTFIRVSDISAIQWKDEEYIEEDIQ